MTQLLERAIILAAQAHAGQVDKGGSAYILHPLRVMLQMDTDEERVAAVLHDVIEDRPDAATEVLELVPVPVAEALERLTRTEAEPYDTYIQRIAEHPLAKKVKIADLRDNLDLSRLARTTKHDAERQIRYKRALRTLTS
jgi:guanosine-3',5'-bis(diphosphate) 3'-pyrophosphohydrolase